MALIELNTNPENRVLRQFGCLGLPLCCGLVGWWLHRAGWANCAVGLWAVGGLSIAVGLVRPSLLRPVFVGLVIVTFPIGWLVSHLLLAAVFYLVITPIGLAMRLAGRDPLGRRFDAAAESYWSEHKPNTEVASYFRQF